jgi:dTDP-4-dehydrorhamnose reductase
MSCSSDELGRAALRPRYSVLRTEREEAIRLPHWDKGLRAYLAECASIA